MNEIWPMEPGWYYIYSEDPELWRYLSKFPEANWFGDYYYRSDNPFAKQYRFPSNKHKTIANRAGL